MLPLSTFYIELNIMSHVRKSKKKMHLGFSHLESVIWSLAIWYLSCYILHMLHLNVGMHIIIEKSF